MSRFLSGKWGVRMHTWRQEKGNDVIAKALYFAVLIFLFFPWFTYGPEMGYFRGVYLLVVYFVPMIVIALFLFWRKYIWLAVFCEVSLLVEVTITVLAIGCWQDIYNIKGGFDWSGGLYTAMPTYWVSLLASFLLLLVIQPMIFKTMNAGRLDT